jgi:hypothetical protein
MIEYTYIGKYSVIGARKMRYKRKQYYRKLRHKKMRQIILLAVVMPSLLILLGYLVASVIILPSMSG